MHTNSSLNNLFLIASSWYGVQLRQLDKPSWNLCVSIDGVSQFRVRMTSSSEIQKTTLVARSIVTYHMPRQT